MSIFAPRFSMYSPEPNFSGLFRLIDEFDRYSSNHAATGGEDGQIATSRRQPLQTFAPKFDLKETEHTYELYGELPGVEKDKVNIEFNDEQTITISGKVERSYSSSSDVEDAVHVEHEHAQDSNSNKEKSKEVAKTGEKQVSTAKGPARPKYWVSERSIGEFSRSFAFPERVESQNVSASMRNGVLSVTVPKAKKPLGRRIAIN